MYSRIYNPKTNRYVKTKSKQGLAILDNYLLGTEAGVVPRGGGDTLKNCKNKLGRNIGEGKFKTAYATKCDPELWKPEGEFSKSFTPTNCKNSVMLVTNESDDDFYRETKIQEKFKHPRIWKYGSCKDSYHKYKIEEKLDEDLFDWIQFNTAANINLLNNKKLLHNFKINFLKMLEQIKQLHDTNMGHFDIKPENIMVKYDRDPYSIAKQFEKIVLIDFGFSREPPVRKEIGTPGFIDPSIIQDKYLSLKSDIWSLGIVIFFSIFGLTDPFYLYDDDLPTGINKLLKLCPMNTESVEDWSQRVLNRFDTDVILTDLLYNMLICPQSDRYDINQVIEHPWFSEELVKTLPTKVVPGVPGVAARLGTAVGWMFGPRV